MLTSLSEAATRNYDYIICGGGPAGLVLAARLTEDTNTSVLVLEAGEAKIDDPTILTPMSSAMMFGNPAYDWGHRTVPQEHCGGTEVAWQRGRVLGGSSAINFCVYTKPPASDIDDIERLGNPGWNWDRFEHYSHKSERFTFPDDEKRKGNKMQLDDWKFGKDGPHSIAFPEHIVEAELHVQQTLVNSGIPIARKPLNGNPTGTFFTPSTLDPTTHTRSYATTAYCQPNIDRANLTVAVSALVHKVVLDSEADGLYTATGVEVSSGGQTFVVQAKKEVIISAGGLKSSQILELSGIGNRQRLEALNIPVRIDNPGVGENVQEHMAASVTWELKEGASFDTVDMLRDPKVAVEHMAMHKAGKGIFNMGMVGYTFVPLEKLSPRAGEIHAEVKDKLSKGIERKVYAPGLAAQYEVMLKRLAEGAPSCELATFPGFLNMSSSPKPNTKYITMACILNHSFSRGSIHITSSQPNVDPAFDPQYFAEPTDLKMLAESVRFARKLAETEPLKSLVLTEANPGPGLHSDEELEAYIKKNVVTAYHTAGAASMMPQALGGVVSPQLKVYGTRNLRVVDMSILPLHFASHPLAYVYALAEQAADIIKSKE